jgi:nucleotide-binding universal stress UspA family protein
MSTDQSGVIVVGVDGSADSHAALRWADQYAAASGSRVRLVSSWEWAMAYGAPMMFEGYHPDADARAMVEKASAELNIPTEHVEVVVREGSPRSVLVEESKSAVALVVGSHGHNALSRALLGSVSAHCVHYASCPVIIVR